MSGHLIAACTLCILEAVHQGSLMELLPLATAVFSKTTISSDVEDENKLLEGLLHSEYDIHSFKPTHRGQKLFLSKIFIRTALSLCDLFPPSIHLFKNLFCGYGRAKFCTLMLDSGRRIRKKMPHSKFFLQSDLEAVGELTRYSELPSFVSNITLKTAKSNHTRRVAIPFSDPESFADFYLICHQRDFPKWKPLFLSV